MWPEDFRRIAPVARAVQARGVPLNFTLEYSHIIFKIGGAPEQAISSIRDDVVAGRMTQYVRNIWRKQHNAQILQ
jgi:hypothetical protein